jgi:hypothetical protein
MIFASFVHKPIYPMSDKYLKGATYLLDMLSPPLLINASAGLWFVGGRFLPSGVGNYFSCDF